MKSPKKFRPDETKSEPLLDSEKESKRLSSIEAEKKRIEEERIKYSDFKNEAEFLMEQGAERERILAPLMLKVEEAKKRILFPIIEKQKEELTKFQAHDIMREAKMAKEKKLKEVKEKKVKAPREPKERKVSTQKIGDSEWGIYILITKAQALDMGYKESDLRQKVKDDARRKLGLKESKE